MCSLEDAWGSSIAAAGPSAKRRLKTNQYPRKEPSGGPEPTFSRGQLLPSSFGQGQGPPPQLEEGFTTSDIKTNRDVNTNYDVTYRAMVNDYKFFCEKYGICADVEAFSLPAPVAPADNITPRKPSNVCGPMLLPNIGDSYSDDMKAQMSKALEASLAEDAARQNALPAPMPMRQVNMAGVTGFYDEELTSFLHANQAKRAFAPTGASAPVPASPPSKAPLPPFVLRAPESGPAPRTMEPGPPKIKWWSMELVLFIITGILIILLMDQLFVIASHIGMRQSVSLLEPILARLEELKRTLPPLPPARA